MRLRGTPQQVERAILTTAERDAWSTVYVDEAALFPNSDYSDQIDASSRAFHRLA